MGRQGRTAALVGLVAASSLIAGCETMNSRPHIDHAASQRVVCTDTPFTIYFERGSDQLTATARQAIAYAAAQVKGCKLGEVEVLGLSGAEGQQPQNLELARRRANVVAQALTGAGLPSPVYDVQALGTLGSRYRGRTVPVSHKTEVVIHASPAS